jgi:hypothetical protein
MLRSLAARFFVWKRHRRKCATVLLFPIPYSLFPASRNDCRIRAAATWSTTRRCCWRACPASYRIWCASRVVSRSSQRWMGSPLNSPSAAANACVLSACGLASPDRCSGLPTTIPTTPNRRASRANERRSSLEMPRALRLRSSVSTGCAVSPSSSDTATPMRRLPTSSPR